MRGKKGNIFDNNLYIKIFKKSSKISFFRLFHFHPLLTLPGKILQEKRLKEKISIYINEQANTICQTNPEKAG